MNYICFVVPDDGCCYDNGWRCRFNNKGEHCQVFNVKITDDEKCYDCECFVDPRSPIAKEK